MTFLPIVDRELRVAARRGGTYWMRLRVALLDVIVGSSILAVNFGAPPAAIGNFIFIGLAVLAFIYCLMSGRNSTADCLSEEKREGTLGLLFLTDLKGYDVVLGKMVATSVNAFYGMLAIFPVLAVPMLMGGVSNGEFWRTVLVLVNTFLFSLAIGIFSSALSRDARRALALNFLLLVFFVVTLPLGLLAVAIALDSQNVAPEIAMPSPLCSFYFALDTGYKLKPALFWWSVAVIHGFTWLLVIQACRIVPRSWQDQPPAPRRAAQSSRGQGFWHFWSYGHPAKRPAFRKSLLDVNAFYWLAARARLKPLHVWAFLAVIGCWWIWGRASSGALWVDESTNVVMALLLNTTLKLWVALEAGQRLAEDKKIGALELLLSTPLTVRDIVRGQLLALRRQFLGPVIFVILLELFLMEASVREGVHYNPEIRVLWIAALIMLVADLATLSLVAMAQALRQKTHNQAILRTVVLILILPWLGLTLEAVIRNLWSIIVTAAPRSPDWGEELAVWFGLGIMTDFIFLWRARWQLLTQMREYATQRSASAPRSGGWFNQRKNQVAPLVSSPMANPAPARNRSKKNLARGVIALVLLSAAAGFFLFRSKPNYPPAIVVPVSLGQGPLKVFPRYGGALFILPDGSLWRWGQIVKTHPKALVPEPLMPGNDWVQTECLGAHWVGLRNDGTIWEKRFNYLSAGESFDPNPTQPDPGHDWIDVSCQGVWSFGIKRDGTLWTWNDGSSGQYMTPDQTNRVRVGTNSDWLSIRGNASSTLALRKNGTLWTTGQLWMRGNTRFTMNEAISVTNVPVPIQVCRETNWVSVSNGTSLARNRDGQWWQLFYAPPAADQSIAAVGRLFYSNAAPDRVAFAYCGEQKVFQIHDDGTLWERSHHYAATAGEPAGNWRQVGRRRDWISLWSGGGTAFGLTADGTIWTWGTDPNLEPVADLAARMRLLQSRLKFGTPPAGVGLTTKPQFQKLPRPLMTLSGAGPGSNDHQAKN